MKKIKKPVFRVKRITNRNPRIYRKLSSTKIFASIFTILFFALFAFLIFQNISGAHLKSEVNESGDWIDPDTGVAYVSRTLEEATELSQGAVSEVVSSVNSAVSQITDAVQDTDSAGQNSSASSSTAKKRSGGSLSLSTSAAPEGVVKIDESIVESWDSNDALIDSLNQKGGLIHNFFKIGKYVLGGIFMLFLGIYVVSLLTSGDKSEAKSNFSKQIMWSFVGFVIFLLAEPFSQIFSLGSAGDPSSILTDRDAMMSAAEGVGFTYRSAAKAIQYILGGLALVFGGVAAGRMIGAVGKEEEISSARKTLIWSAIGLMIAGGTGILIDKVLAPMDSISSATNPLEAQKLLMEAGQMQARDLVRHYIKYFQTFVGAIAVAMLFLAGAKMVAASGDEETIEKQKKIIPWVFLGLGIILFSELIVYVFLPQKDGQIVQPGEEQFASFATQIGGLTNFILTFSGVLAVLALVVGALFYSTAAANPEQAEQGKKILLAAGLGIVVIISAYAIVNTVLSGNAIGDPGGINITTQI